MPPSGVLLVGGRQPQWLTAQWQATFLRKWATSSTLPLLPKASTLFGLLPRQIKKKKGAGRVHPEVQCSQFLRFHAEPNLMTILKNKGQVYLTKEDNFLERGGTSPRVILVTDQAHTELGQAVSSLSTPPQPVMDTEKGVHDETVPLQSLALPIMLTKLSISDSSWQHDKNTKGRFRTRTLDLS